LRARWKIKRENASGNGGRGKKAVPNFAGRPAFTNPEDLPDFFCGNERQAFLFQKRIFILRQK